MKSTTITTGAHHEVLSAGARKDKVLLAHPLTFLGLVCVFLGLAFYVANQFI